MHQPGRARIFAARAEAAYQLCCVLCVPVQLAFDSEGIALTSTMGFVRNPVRRSSRLLQLHSLAK